MKGKKSFAALAAVIMTVSAVSVFPGTAFADGEQAQTDSGAAVSYGNETGSAVMQAAGSPDLRGAQQEAIRHILWAEAQVLQTDLTALWSPMNMPLSPRSSRQNM